MACESSATIYTVDAFSSTPFEGNPAAVCLFNNSDSVCILIQSPLHAIVDMHHVDNFVCHHIFQGRADELLQRIAFEMNLSETAFLQELDGHGVASGKVLLILFCQSIACEYTERALIFWSC